MPGFIKFRIGRNILFGYKSENRSVPDNGSRIIQPSVSLYRKSHHYQTLLALAECCNLLKLPEMKLIEFTKEAIDENLLSKGGRTEDLTERISP